MIDRFDYWFFCWYGYGASIYMKQQF